MAKRHGPWQITDTEQVYKDDFVELTVDQVLRPDGEPGRYATVSVKPGVAVLALDRDGSVHLIRQFRYALGADDLEVVTGGLEPGETPLEAAQKELREELGGEAETWDDLGMVQIETSIIRCPVSLFIARDVRFHAPDSGPTEQIKPVQMSLAEAHGMVLRGEITHAATCLLLLRAMAG